ncbi:hypothetical protein [Vibrio sp. 10N.247.311.26]|uniref:hypothetical protein n=1 Tax=Vibrio sp. 10N.247.311.26 TaxID=3229995 RepID=UPI00354E3B42
MSYEIKNAEILNKIVGKIKKEHENEPERGFMADDQTNERISWILDDFGIMNDDSVEIEEKFGHHGLDIIREAEQGSYQDIKAEVGIKTTKDRKSKRINRP